MSISQFTKLEDRLLLLDRANALLDAGFRIRPKEFKLTKADHRTIQEARDRSRAEQRNVAKQLAHFEGVAYNRVIITLSLLANEDLSGRIKDQAEMKKQAEKLMRAWNRLADHFEVYRSLESEYHKIYTLAVQLEDNPDNEKLS